ncbi:unnamed protein product [Arctogadus glacialis]
MKHLFEELLVRRPLSPIIVILLPAHQSRSWGPTFDLSFMEDHKLISHVCVALISSCLGHPGLLVEEQEKGVGRSSAQGRGGGGLWRRWDSRAGVQSDQIVGWQQQLQTWEGEGRRYYGVERGSRWREVEKRRGSEVERFQTGRGGEGRGSEVEE